MRTQTFVVSLSPLQIDVMVLKAGEREQEVRDVRREISDTLRLIQRLKGDLEALARKVRFLTAGLCAPSHPLMASSSPRRRRP